MRKGEKHGKRRPGKEWLTALAVKRLRKPGRHADGGGLYLAVSERGARSWVFMWKRNGKRRALGLGPTHTVTLDEARNKARDARRALVEERDPRSAKSTSFGKAADTLFESMAPSWRNPVHQRQWRHSLLVHCAPLRDKPVSKITTDDVLDVIGPLWRKHPETGSRVRGRIEAVLNWASARGLRDGENPARWRGHLDRLLPNKSKVREQQHHAAVPFDQVPALMAELRGMEGIPGRALEFTILTAARPGEVRGMHWGEIDLDGKVWTVPKTRTKSGREHRVPLSSRADAILREMQKKRRSDYVFPGQRDNRPLNDLTINAALQRAGVKATVHGTSRSSFRDWAAERTNTPHEVCEMALGHVISNAVEAAYRRGDLFAKRTRLMDAWAQFGAKPETGKVVPLRA